MVNVARPSSDKRVDDPVAGSVDRDVVGDARPFGVHVNGARSQQRRVCDRFQHWGRLWAVQDSVRDAIVGRVDADSGATVAGGGNHSHTDI